MKKKNSCNILLLTMDDDNSMFFNKLQYLIDRLIPMSINTLVRFYEHLKGFRQNLPFGDF